MREILFRGKRVDNGKWAYGNIVFTRSGRAFKLDGTFFTGETHEGNFKLGEIYGMEVIPETVGQYTGLTDKNGVRIFEGDILKSWRNSLYVVKFGHFIDDAVVSILEPDELEEIEPVLGWYCEEVRTNQKFGFYNDMSHLEIIGNIHENIEPLKGVRK